MAVATWLLTNFGQMNFPCFYDSEYNVDTSFDITRAKYRISNH